MNRHQDPLRELFAANGGDDPMTLTDLGFDGQDLRDANLTNASLGNVSLRGCDLRGVSFSGADVQADFTGANLVGAQLDARAFHGSNFTRADCSGCNFGSADMDNADLLEADLRGADLSLTVGVREKEFHRAITNETTVPPTRFQEMSARVAAWERRAQHAVRLSNQDARIYEEETGRPYPNPVVG